MITPGLPQLRRWQALRVIVTETDVASDLGHAYTERIVEEVKVGAPFLAPDEFTAAAIATDHWPDYAFTGALRVRAVGAAA